MVIPWLDKDALELLCSVTTITSFLGGSFAILLLMSFAPILAKFAIGFGSVEYFAIMVLGLVAASTIGIGSPVKGLTMVVFGVILGLVGTDVSTGVERYTFDFFHLHDGISLVALADGNLWYFRGISKHRPECTFDA